MMINSTPPAPFARVTWRGSHASARMLADYVNLIDSVDYRAGGKYAEAKASFEDYTIGDPRNPIRHVRSGECTVDAYDGRHHLNAGDTLVQTEDGWTVERNSNRHADTEGDAIGAIM